MRVRPAGATSLVLAALLSACVGGTTPNRPSMPAATRGVGAAPRSDAVYVRTCETSVYGAFRTGWERGAVVAGPIAFVGLGGKGRISAKGLAAADLGPTYVLKLLAVVAAHTRVTVSVDPSESEHVALSYDPSRFDARRIEDAERAVTFAACGGGGTRFGDGRGIQFNGGLIVDGPLCADLDVRWPGGSRRVRLSLGHAC
jgi:hypothetical protein